MDKLRTVLGGRDGQSDNRNIIEVSKYLSPETLVLRGGKQSQEEADQIF